MSSRIFETAEAQTLGIIAKHVANHEIDTAIEAEVAPYLSVAPSAVGAAKKLARSLGPTINRAVIDATIEQLADIWEGEEATHGLDAFLNKTSPKWANKSG